MKKILALFVLAFAFLLAGCSQSVSVDGVKSNLQGSGYTVEVMGQTEAKARISGVTYTTTPTNVVYAVKGTDIAIIFFFSNIDEAEKFVNENIAVMVRFAEKVTDESPKTGSHNNAAYCGSYNAIKAAGFPVSK